MILTSLALAGLFLFLADLREVRSILLQADWTQIPLVLVFTGISYFSISYSFARLGKLIGLRMSLSRLASVGFVSAALNRVVSGAAGTYLRYEVLKREGASLGEVLILSLLHSYLTSMVMMALFPVGLIHLLRSSSTGREGAIVAGIAWLLVLAILLTASGLLFSGRLRTRFLSLIEKRAGFLLRQGGRTRLREFEATLTRIIRHLKSRPSEMVFIIGLIAVDLAASAAALWFSLAALGPALSAPDLVSGFVIGTTAGGIVSVAGGLGIQEISMVGTFSYLGTTLELATLGSILFRVLYFFIPFIVSVGFYLPWIKQFALSKRSVAGGPKYAHSDA